MKLLYIFLLTLPLLCHAQPVEVDGEKVLSLEDDDADNDQAGSDKDSAIQKRSGGEGSFSYVTQIKSGLLSSLGHASASIASGSSGSSSSSGGGSYKSIDAHHHGNSVEYDPWSFKKSLLNTIFQAVKAITGGVTALKGQLIKGSGYALSASGHVVAVGGDKVTDVGKSIINAAHQNTPTYGPPSHGGGYVHPFAKFSSLSGASSSSSSDSSPPSKPGPVIHTETITSYEIPGGHANYGPPSKPPTYSSATHQYLPAQQQSSGGYGGGAPFSNGHVAFEAPSYNYLPTSYDVRAGNNENKLYEGRKPLTDEEARRAAIQLQEILNMLPNGKTEYTASKTVTLNPYANNDVHPEHFELHSYGLGPLEAISHTESVTAAYGPPPQQYLANPADIYQQMDKKQQKSPEEIYIQKHPEEGYYDYTPPKKTATQDYHYHNYHVEGNSNSNALHDLTPILAALETTKRHTPSQNQYHTQYSIEKNVQKVPSSGSAYSYLPPVVKKKKYTFIESGPNGNFDGTANMYQPPPPPVHPPVPYKIHQIISGRTKRKTKPIFSAHDYEIQDPLIFNRVLTL